MHGNRSVELWPFVVAVLRDQPHVSATPLDAQPIAVVLDLMEPVGAIGYGFGAGGQAEFEHAGHGCEIVMRPQLCESCA